MKFMVDECTGPTVAKWLVHQGHDVVSVFDAARGSEDDHILEWAVREDRVLITIDKDFGELIFREKKPHRGIVLLRLNDQSPANSIAALERLFQQTIPTSDQYVVVSDAGVRVVVT